ncbi:hypothetical protein OEA41_010350 [Lepraria neglecta]|uniref:PH domain-containing protein n=1 Tax=Lepraria neglecta TaxID=209136 RepID=A0AAD9YWE6_9LECA|nr:hypothetical protein OEA41_010350 [Lepraria neglecta]
MAHSLVAVAETAQDVGSGFSKFLDPVADASAEIAALIAECFSTSADLRKLDRAIEEFEFDRSYARIRGDIAIVKDSLVYTFRDVQRLFGVGLGRATILPGLEYRQVWRDLTTHFQEESNNTLERRLKLYQEFIKELTFILLEGAPRSRDQFEDLGLKIRRLLHVQEQASIVDDFDRAAIGTNRRPSFERVRPRDEQLRQPRPELRPEPGRRPPRPQARMEYDWDDEPYPRRRDPRRRRTVYPRDDDDDYYYDRDGRLPRAPEPPLSPTGTFSSHSSSTRSVGEHWLPLVFEQGQPPTTLLGTTGQTSIVLGEDISHDARRRLRDEYEKLIEIAEDTVNPVSGNQDAELRHEEVVFAGRIIDDHYEHALRLFQEEDSGGLRLEASVVRGDLKRTPVWTAFITHQIQSRRWMRRASSRVVHLADLQRFVFTEGYRPQMAVEGQHELTFVDPEGKIPCIPWLLSMLIWLDARDFTRHIDRLADDEED